jgi:hypothetical protein
MIFHLTRPQYIASWLRTNAPSIVAANSNKTTSDIWRAYLRSLPVTGGTQRDLENAYLTQQSNTTQTELRGRYAVYAGQSVDCSISQKMRLKYA